MPTDKRGKNGGKQGKQEAVYLQEELDLLPFQDVSIGEKWRASQWLQTAKRKRDKRD